MRDRLKEELENEIADCKKTIKEKDKQIKELQQKLTQMRITLADRTRERPMYIHAGRIREFRCMCGRLYINEDWHKSEEKTGHAHGPKAV